MTALSDLLNARKPRDRSAREVARRAQGKGHDLAEPTATSYFGGRHAKRTSLSPSCNKRPVSGDRVACMRRVWVGLLVAGIALAGCGGSPDVSEKDRAACGRYVWAHASFRSVVEDISEVTRSGGAVSESLRDEFESARSAAYASVGDALAVADDPDLVIALRRADAAKAGLLSSDADEAAAYALVEGQVKRWCSESVGGL